VPLIYILSHVSFFVYHPSLIAFIAHKKWMVSWFTGAVRIFGNIWRNLLTGYYLDPSFKVVRNQHWNLTVPAVVVFSLIPFKKILVSKKSSDLLILYGLCILYLIYVTVLTDGAQKFIMPIYPLLCIMAVGNLRWVYSIIITWKKWGLKHSEIN